MPPPIRGCPLRCPPVPPPAHLAHGGVVSLVGVQLVLDELRQHGVVFVVPAEGGGGDVPFPLSPGNLVSPRVPPRAPLCRLPPVLTRGTARPGTPSAWRTAWRSAPPAAPGSGSSSGPCGGCKSSGRSRPNPGSRPGERSGRALSGAGTQGHRAAPAGWGTRPKPRQVPGPGCRFGNVQGVLWGSGCHHCALSPSPAPAPWCSPWTRAEPPGARPAPAHSIACTQAGNQGGEEEQGQ